MNIKILLLLLIMTGIFLMGCSSRAVITEEAKTDEEQLIENIYPTKEDTVRIRPYTDLTPEPRDTEITEPRILYTVQIGAYRNPVNAQRSQQIAQGRFNLEIITEYDQQDGLYKIRLGEFKTYDQARTFRDQIRRQYPGNYLDAWIVVIYYRDR